ncbi:hypothetical protein B0H13DRAFT_2012010, partial [Mycena leptocephala]
MRMCACVCLSFCFGYFFFCFLGGGALVSAFLSISLLFSASSRSRARARSSFEADVSLALAFRFFPLFFCCFPESAVFLPIPASEPCLRPAFIPDRALPFCHAPRCLRSREERFGVPIFGRERALSMRWMNGRRFRGGGRMARGASPTLPFFSRFLLHSCVRQK